MALIRAGGYKRIGAEIEESFKNVDSSIKFDYFNGECSKTEINRLISVMQESGCGTVIGIGGDKIFDTAKAVICYTKVLVLICPTIASTDAPCSALSVTYTDDGVFEEYLFLPSNSNMVLMDTDIITKSLIRLTMASGEMRLPLIFDARACKRSEATSCTGGKNTQVAMALAKLCFDMLMMDGGRQGKACARSRCLH